MFLIKLKTVRVYVMYTFDLMLILVIEIIEIYFSTRCNLIYILNGFKLFQYV